MSETLVRRTLLFTAAYNVMGAAIFLLPQSLGLLAGIPGPAAFLYTGFLGLNILLFAFVGLWQARAQTLSRPVLIIFGVSKITFCLVMLVTWLRGEAAATSFLLSLADLVMGMIFLEGARHVDAWNRANQSD